MLLWHKALSNFLWISPRVLLVVLAVILYKRRLYREFPCFFALVLYDLAKFILLFILSFPQGVTGKYYTYVFPATLVLSVALRFGVIDEVSRNLFRESQFLQVRARWSLQFAAVVLLIFGFLFVVYSPGNNMIRWQAGVTAVNGAAALVQCGLVLSLLLFARFLGLTWRRSVFGIALGLGILSSIDLATSALRAEFTSAAMRDSLNYWVTGVGLVYVPIWIGYLLVPERSPAPVVVVSNDEVESWNKELQRLARHSLDRQ